MATTEERVRQVFEALRAAGFVALEDAGVTQGDGLADCREEFVRLGGAGSGFWAFCFYTRQDLERSAGGGGLSLAFGAGNGSATDSVRAGEAICAAFRGAGFGVAWNGDPGTRPEVDVTLEAPPEPPDPTAEEVPMAPLTDLAALSVSVEASTQPVERGWLARISTEHGISPVGFNALLSEAGELLFAANVYKDDHGYECAYLRLSAGGVLVAQREDRGLMPTFVEAADGRTWSLILDPYGDRDVTRALPLRDRADTPEAKPMPANLGDLFSGRWLVKRPSKRTGSDKVTELVLAKGTLKRGKAITLEGPGYNALIATDAGFESLAATGAGHVHRRFDPKGALVGERALDLGLAEGWHPAEPVSLSFDEPSVLLTGGASVDRVVVDPGGSVRRTTAVPRPAMNLWAPKTCGDVAVTNFNGEAGTGWVAFRGEDVVDAFMIEGSTAVDVHTGERLDLHLEGLVVETVAVNGSGYRVVLRETERSSRELVVLRRDLA